LDGLEASGDVVDAGRDRGESRLQRGNPRPGWAGARHRSTRAFRIQPFLDPALDELPRPEAFGRRQLLQEREAAGIDTDGHAALVGSGPRRIATAGPWGIRRPPLARREVSRCLIAEASAGRAAARRATAMRTEVAVATTATSATGTPLAAVSASFVGHPRTLPATSGIGQREP